ncbi:MAG: hypothetical protein LBU09_00765, partial [Endomicrobium sp.]|nr:hypothetical protein [Endomicrobium sp.]
MIKRKLSLLLFFLFVFSVCAFAQSGDGVVSNGGTISSDSGGNTHFTSINGGIVFAQPLQTLDYRLDSGILATFEPESDKIEFSNVSTSAFLGALISADIKTTTTTLSITTLRQVAYRVSTGTVPDEYAPYTLVLSSASGYAWSTGTFSIEASTANNFTWGTNYVQWYAQNTEGDWATYTAAVYISTGISASFIKPAPG